MSTTQPIRNSKQLELLKDYYLEAKPNKRNYVLVITALNSALRISDILSLKLEDVYDYGHGRLRTHLCVREKKTGKTSRIRINKKLQRALEANVAFSEKEPGAWLFPSQLQKEKPLSRVQAYRIVKEAAYYAGLGDEDISCHSLRKTFGYYAWKNGTPPAVLMNIYNHSSYQITKCYLGIEQDDRDEVFMNMEL